MGISVKQEPPLPLDWQKSETYQWMNALPRMAWAWELMRRNPEYRSHYAKVGPSTPAPQLRDLWPLVRFEDPALDARSAAVLWQREVCSEVLPVAISAQFQNCKIPRLSLQELHCRVITLPGDNPDHCHILFSQQGRSLQLSVCGASLLDRGSILTPMPADLTLHGMRHLGVRRLADLLDCGCLRPSLYPPEARAVRLTRVMQALDGELAGAAHREIGTALYGKERVEQEWHHPHNYLRDHVRRAIAHGRDMMFGYKRLLR